MGGDSSPDEIVRLSRFLQTQTIAKVKVGWYSGKQDLPSSFSLEYFQYIKTGAYIEQSGSLKSITTNQRLHKIEEGGEMVDVTSLFWNV